MSSKISSGRENKKLLSLIQSPNHRLAIISLVLKGHPQGQADDQPIYRKQMFYTGCDKPHLHNVMGEIHCRDLAAVAGRNHVTQTHTSGKGKQSWKSNTLADISLGADLPVRPSDQTWRGRLSEMTVLFGHS